LLPPPIGQSQHDAGPSKTVTQPPGQAVLHDASCDARHASIALQVADGGHHDGPMVPLDGQDR
jgi:hypothetical protein